MTKRWALWGLFAVLSVAALISSLGLGQSGIKPSAIRGYFLCHYGRFRANVIPQ